MNRGLENALMGYLLKSYRDVKYPDFSFAMKNYASPRRSQLRGLLNDDGAIDNTDLNYDVCESFEMNDGNGIIYLYISLVGPYCFALKNDVVINENTENIQTKTWFSAMKKAGIIWLDKKQLLHHLPVLMECADEKKHASVLALFFAPGLSIQP